MRKRFGGKQKTSLCHWQSVTQWYSKKIWVDGAVRKQVRKAIRPIRICASSSVICGVSRTVGLFDQSRTLAAAKCFLNNKQPMVRGNATKNTTVDSDADSDGPYCLLTAMIYPDLRRAPLTGRLIFSLPQFCFRFCPEIFRLATRLKDNLLYPDTTLLAAEATLSVMLYFSYTESHQCIRTERRVSIVSLAPLTLSRP